MSRPSVSSPSDPNARRRLAFVDIETTGGLASEHRITEIAVIGMQDGEVEFEWHTLVNPEVRIPTFIRQLTGIDDEMVREAPRFAEIAAALRERLDGRTFAAHNVRFDYGFVRSEFLRLGLHWQAPTLCTARLSRRLYPAQRRHNLDTLIEAHGFACRARHRALGDADVLRQFWQHVRMTVAPETLDAALEAISPHAALPAHLNLANVEQLPETPGVYEFFGEDGTLLYVGKAKRLRERVFTHFSGAHRDAKSQQLAARVHRVQWQCHAGELGALLEEARRVRCERPVYNRALRGGAVYGWQFTDPVQAPRVVPLDWTTLHEAELYGAFRSASAARKALAALAAAQGLCRKALGLEAGGGACFDYQLGRCRGVCAGRESAALHGVRVRLAMAAWKMPAWPFAGPVAVLERSADLTELLILDAWQYCGALRLEGDAEGLGEAELLERCREVRLTRAAHEFDADAYRILRRYLGSKRRARVIELA